jgi:O-methyltransferase
MKQLIKSAFKLAGLTLARRDPDVELIPSGYHSSPFLPKVYRQTLGLVPYFASMVESVKDVPGDIVECGVSIGHGLLIFMLAASAQNQTRMFYGFDSFEGFPDNSQADRTREGTFTVSRGVYATPPSVVLRTLRDGRVPEELIQNNLVLRKGFFETTLPSFDRKIALLHLDCDLYESYKTCLNHLYHKVVPGGVIMFDEYEDETFPGGKVAIDEFFANKPEKLQQHSYLNYIKYYVRKV